MCNSGKPNIWRFELESALEDFVGAARLAGIDLRPGDLRLEILDAPHRQPSNLPSGMMALYGFCGPDGWLKIGIAGRQSQARYTSQHYNAGSAPSTLAASLVKDPSMSTCDGFCIDSPGEWIRSNCHRVNVLIDAEYGRPLLALLEAFLHVRLKPRYER